MKWLTGMSLKKISQLFAPLSSGAFCQFSFRWIYYYHSSKSTGKETGKTHLCVHCMVRWIKEFSTHVFKINQILSPKFLFSILDILYPRDRNFIAHLTNSAQYVLACMHKGATTIQSDAHIHGLRTPNEGIKQIPYAHHQRPLLIRSHS